MPHQPRVTAMASSPLQRRLTPFLRTIPRRARWRQQARARRVYRPRLEPLEVRLPPTMSTFGQFDGLVTGAGGAAANPVGAAGPNSYVETADSTVAIYGKDGTLIASDDLGDFLFTRGGLTPLGS